MDIVKIMLYGFIYGIFIIFFKLIEYTNIHEYIAETSRCFKKTNGGNHTANTYIIRGYTSTHIEVVKIIYDFSNKTEIVEFTAPKGEVLNKVSIPIYNIRTRQSEEIERIFYAETEFEQPLIYEGLSDIIRFMEYADTDFFENKLLDMKDNNINSI